jgi:type II secretory pathway pseudopilin PulG
VELLVVLTILTLMGGIMLPAFLASRERAQLRGAIDAILSDLNLARARAISAGLRHQFVLDPGTREVYVAPFRPEEAAAAQGPAAALPATVLEDRLPEGVEIDEWAVVPAGPMLSTPTGSSAVGIGTLNFYAEGVSDSARLVLNLGRSNARGIIVDGLTGEIREMTAEEISGR